MADGLRIATRRYGRVQICATPAGLPPLSPPHYGLAPHDSLRNNLRVGLKHLLHILLFASAGTLFAANGDAPAFQRVRRATDVHGTAHQLGATRGIKAIVLVFLGPECPISQRYAPELNRLAAAHTNDIEFYGVISGPSMTRTQALAFVKDYALRFPVLFDEGGALARWLRPTHMPEAFVLKPGGDVLYHGRIDDWYESPGKPRVRAQQHELRDALIAVLAGNTPPKMFAPPVGCYFEDWPANPKSP